MVGADWRQGRFRYIDRDRELYLEKLIKGERPEVTQGAATTLSGTSVLNIEIMPHINDQLEKIAHQEGRQKDEIIREAIAEWLKGR